MVDRDDADVPATDLSALDPHHDALLADRVIVRAMTRIGAPARRMMPTSASVPVLGDVARWWQPGLVAAALVAIVAGATVVFAPFARADGSIDESVEAQILDWARTGHVPSNGDLLSAFRVSAR